MTKEISEKVVNFANVRQHYAEAKINGNPEATSSGNASPGYVFVMGVNAGCGLLCGYYLVLRYSWKSLIEIQSALNLSRKNFTKKNCFIYELSSMTSTYHAFA